MNPIFQVYRKELRELMRDKRVRNSAFVVPIFVVLLVVQMMSFIESSVSGAKKQKVHYVRTSNPDLALIKDMTLVPVESVAKGEELIKKGEAKIVLNFLPPANGQTVVDAYFDPKEEIASITMAEVAKKFALQNATKLAAILSAKGVPLTAMEPIKFEQKEVQVGEKGASRILVGFLPYLIVMWAFYGGMSLVSDLVAGEKEKNTLETLLIAPVKRTQIVLGKFLSLATICLLSSMSALLGLVLSNIIFPAHSDTARQGMGVTPVAAVVTLITIIPLVAFFASGMLAVSSYAKNPREAQTHLSLLSFLVVVPAVFSQIIGFTDLGSSKWVNFVPILNTANTIRNALMGKTDWAAVGITISVSLVLGAIALRIVLHFFNREEVLTRV